MGRRSRNKQQQPVPKTTLSISVDLATQITKLKDRRQTMDEFLRRVFEQWLEWKDTIPFMEDAYEKQSKVIERLNERLNTLSSSSSFEDNHE